MAKQQKEQVRICASCGRVEQAPITKSWWERMMLLKPVFGMKAEVFVCSHLEKGETRSKCVTKQVELGYIEVWRYKQNNELDAHERERKLQESLRELARVEEQAVRTIERKQKEEGETQHAE